MYIYIDMHILYIYIYIYIYIYLCGVIERGFLKERGYKEDKISENIDIASGIGRNDHLRKKIH